MKNTIYLGLFFTLLISCEKKENILTSETEEQKINTEVTSNPLAQFKQLSPTEVSNLLNTKNDTLYITNFFATWCGPCVRELPHFNKKMQELKDQPVKFTFINLDQKTDWEKKVVPFTKEHNITEHTVLLDANTLSQEFFSENFSTWDGNSIPFTIIRKGEQTDETVGMMTASELDRKTQNFLNNPQ